MIRVVAASTSDVGRAGVESIIAGAGDLEFAGSAATADQLAHLVATASPDVIVIDTAVDDGLAAFVAAVDRDAGGPGVVVLADLPIAEVRDELGVLAVATALLPHRAGAREIEAAIRAVAAGLFVTHAEYVERGARVALGHDLDDGAAPLTAREIEVLGMLAAGLPNKAIARRLGVSAHTVKFHVGSILSKLHASSRTEAVTDGIRRGLIFL